MERLDFNKTVEQFNALGNNAKVTLMYRLIQTMTPGTLRSILQYGFTKLDRFNKGLPDGHPYKRQTNHFNIPQSRTQYDRENQTHHQPAEQPV